MVIPFLLSATVTSLEVPVSDPSGSPLTRASAAGAATSVRAPAADIPGAGAGAAAGGAAPGAAGTGVCAKPGNEKRNAAAKTISTLFVVVFILISPHASTLHSLD